MGNVAHADETKREATKAREENKGEERREREREEEASDREFREQSGLPTGALTDP